MLCEELSAVTPRATGSAETGARVAGSTAWSAEGGGAEDGGAEDGGAENTTAVGPTASTGAPPPSAECVRGVLPNRRLPF